MINWLRLYNTHSKFLKCVPNAERIRSFYYTLEPKQLGRIPNIKVQDKIIVVMSHDSVDTKVDWTICSKMKQSKLMLINSPWRLTKREKRTLVILKLFFSPIIKSVFLIKPWSMRRWYRHLVGFGRKASSQLFEGVFQSENPRVGGRGGEGQCGRPEYSIHIATTATTRSVTRLD
jgi:hypothetical protein